MVDNGQRPTVWDWRQSALICASLMIIGFGLQWAVGSVVWTVLAWPVNIITLVALLLGLLIMHALRNKVHLFRYLSTLPAAIPSIATTLILTMAMGLIRQDTNGHWLHHMLTSWAFVLAYAYMTVIIGLTTLRRLSKIATSLRKPKRTFSLSDLAFIFNHAGLFVALTCGTLGNPDIQSLKMIANIGAIEWRGADDNGMLHNLPIAIELQRFIMETYDDGSPRRFASDIHVLTKHGKELQATVDVNHPLEIDGWKIYQYGYDTQAGVQSRISIFEFVRDPWLPYVYVGILMMLAGALFMLFGSSRKEVKTS